ncbi:hypothetical protein QYE47_02595 [Pseudomonas sp. 2,4-D]|uniref:hypothetical protein n=1 Tax=Pseudomonas sp. 2,4-D TaxID=3058433 RepID=UPI0026020863|nr:hypothetical protein [Pseudomonas sp. 2,4-D]MDN4511397.1 hypothetical protein [Pseudomonas sp. 2,4-D]
MKVFISWSGNRSRAVAEVLSDWIKCVLQASEPWISTRHIDRGSLWFSEINEKLRDISVGIVCLTQDNKDKPWILFESGALAKGLSGNRVCTFLVDLQPHDLTDPLAQFNHTKPDKESVWELVRTLNACLVDRALDERVLEKAFLVYWPQFETEFALALANNEPDKVTKPRSQQDVLTEILGATRELTRRISKLESGQRLHSKSSLEGPKGLEHFMTYPANSTLNRLLRESYSADEIVKLAKQAMSEEGRPSNPDKKEGDD